MIELRHIRYFLAAAEHGSFRKAALALATQESSISRRIRDLEDRLGASLFQRHSGGVVLTLAGHELLHQARTAMKHLGEGVRDVRSIGRNESGHLRVGVHSTLAFGFLADLFQTYAVDARGVRIDFSDGATIDHVAAVRLHQLDIAFVVGTQDRVGCKTMSLWVEKVFAVLPSNHVLANQLSLGWQDLLNEEFIVSEQAQGREIQEFLIGHLSGLGQSPQVRGQNVGRDNLMSLVAIGRGLTLTTEATIFTDFPGLTYRPIEGETLTFSAVWLPANDNPALRQLLSMALARRKAAGFHGLTTIFPTDPPPAALSRIPDPWP